jgi:hypothetical protein
MLEGIEISEEVQMVTLQTIQVHAWGLALHNSFAPLPLAREQNTCTP